MESVLHILSGNKYCVYLNCLAHASLSLYRMYFGLTEIRMEADFGTGIIHKVQCNFDAFDKYDTEEATST